MCSVRKHWLSWLELSFNSFILILDILFRDWAWDNIEEMWKDWTAYEASEWQESDEWKEFMKITIWKIEISWATNKIIKQAAHS